MSNSNKIKKMIDRIVRASGVGLRKKELKIAKYWTESVRNTPGTYCYDVHQRMNPDHFLPCTDFVEYSEHRKTMDDLLQKTDKIRVRILYPCGDSWGTIRSLFEELKADDRYQVFVIVDNFPNLIRVVENKNCDYITVEDYDMKVDHPTLFLTTAYSAPYTQFNFPGARDCADMVISVFPNFVINETDLDMHWNYVKRAYTNLEPDYYFLDCLPYRNTEGYLPQEKCVNMGHLIFDELYHDLNSVEIPEEWSKLKGKKVFLWGTDHGLNEDHPIEALSFDLYIKDMFAYFTEHPELGLIFRPHPYLIHEMVYGSTFWSSADFERIKRFCKCSPNIVWDDTPDYCQSFQISDALLIDANCGFTITYLCTGKPLCRLLRDDIECKLIHPELKENYYYAKNFTECKKFIEDVCSGQDPKKEMRLEMFNASILHFDGKNGKRMKAFIDHIFL